jgi:hypothetical protein
MTSNIESKESTLVKQSPPKAKQKRKKIVIILVILIGVIIITAIVISQIPTGGKYTFTGYRCTIKYTTHSPSGNFTITKQWNNNTWTVRYDSNEQVYLDMPFFNNVSGGTTTVSNFVCNTPGFSLNKTSLSFPFTIPTALNASISNNNILVRLTFNTPSVPYAGPLIYTIYYEYYP